MNSSETGTILCVEVDDLFSLGQMSELKLGGSREKIDHHRLTLNVSETDPKLQCWTELKVRDRFIHKRSYQASVIYDSR